MDRKLHQNIQPYDYDRFNIHHAVSSSSRQEHDHQTTGIEYQDDSSSLNSDEESYLHHKSQSNKPDNKKDGYYSSFNDKHKPNSSSGMSQNHNNRDYRYRDRDRDRDRYQQKTSKTHPAMASSSVSTQFQHGERATTSNDATGERLNKLENMLEELLKRSLATPEHNFPVPLMSNSAPSSSTVESRDNRNLLEPRRHDFTTSMWINKIEEIAIQNKYSEGYTIRFMESQMSGTIKAWYKSLPNHDYTWPEWKLLILQAFPDNTDFVTTLKRLVTRLKQANETITNYYFSKTYLLEACKITGEDAVMCIIDGLNNQEIQEQAKMQNYLTPETFFSQYLISLPDYTVDYSPSVPLGSAVAPVDVQPNNWFYPGADGLAVANENKIVEFARELTAQLAYDQDDRIKTEQFHFPVDGGLGDIRSLVGGIQFAPPAIPPKQRPLVRSKRRNPVPSRLDKRFMKNQKYGQRSRSTNNKPANNNSGSSSKKPETNENNMCTNCNNRGHVAKTCARKKVLLVRSSRNKPHACYYKQCRINNGEEDILAYLDTGCEEVLIRQDIAEKICSSRFKSTSREFIVSYGGKEIETAGLIDIHLEIEKVASHVEALVMPKDVQDIPVIVGQTFLNQKGIGFTVKNGRLSVFRTHK